MKHISTIVNATLAAVMILILLSMSLPNFSAQAATATQTVTEEPAQDQELSCSPERSVQVSGTAVLNVPPDRALIQLGVQSNGKTPKEVQAKNATAINNVIKALKGLGVEAKDISTDRYVIEPIYEDYDSLHIKGYRIYNLIAITMRDVDKTSDAIATAFPAGANQVVNVEFYTSELRKYRDQAREMATTAAHEKADALSQAAGAKTGCILNISENSWSYFSGHNWWYGGNNQNVWTQNVAQNVAPSGGSAPTGDETPVSAGQVSIRAEVSLTFALQ
ncbi:MAG TPA: SIMPL domain-containing protein [Anaerolineales bacterium]|nr:SIMPL domain-containing protein [Anaerolineales bacterium]